MRDKVPRERSDTNPRKGLKQSTNNNQNNKHARHKYLFLGSTKPQRSAYILIVEVTIKV